MAVEVELRLGPVDARVLASLEAAVEAADREVPVAARVERVAVPVAVEEAVSEGPEIALVAT